MFIWFTDQSLNSVVIKKKRGTETYCKSGSGKPKVRIRSAHALT